MKHYEKDALTIGLINNFLKGTNKKLIDYIPDYDLDKFIQLSDSLPFSKDGEATVEALKYIANECYKRLSKKFPKG